MPTLTEAWNDFVAPIIGVWDELVEYVMWASCSALDFVNAALRWALNEEVLDG